MLSRLLIASVCLMVGLGSIAEAHMPQFLDVARDGDGRVKTMTQPEAIEYCESEGARLPSVYELAELAMTFGAKGYRSMCGMYSERRCHNFETINADGNPETFFFSLEGYRPPSEYLNNGFWSSSVVPKYPEGVYTLFGGFGMAFWYSSTNKFNAVRCVVGG